MNHKNKILGAILSAIFIIIYAIVFYGFIIYAVPGIWKLIFGIIPIVIGILIIIVCIQRVREIKGGEEDDLSKY